MKVLAFVKQENVQNENLERITARLKESGITVEVIDTETREGTQRAQTYDVYVTPSLFVITDFGVVTNSWIANWPSPEEVINASAI